MKSLRIIFDAVNSVCLLIVFLSSEFLAIISLNLFSNSSSDIGVSTFVRYVFANSSISGILTCSLSALSSARVLVSSRLICQTFCAPVEPGSAFPVISRLILLVTC